MRLSRFSFFTQLLPILQDCAVCPHRDQGAPPCDTRTFEAVSPTTSVLKSQATMESRSRRPPPNRCADRLPSQLPQSAHRALLFPADLKVFFHTHCRLSQAQLPASNHPQAPAAHVSSRLPRTLRHIDTKSLLV